MRYEIFSAAFFRVITFAGALLLLSPPNGYAQIPIDTTGWPAGVAPRDTLPKGDLDYDFDSVELKEVTGWVEWAGIDIPVEASGKVSGWLWGKRSAKGWFDVGNFHIEGELTSPKLKIADYFVNQATVRFGFAEGVFYVGKLGGEIISSITEQRLGDANLAALVPANTKLLLDTSVNLSDVELSNIVEALGFELPLQGGQGQIVVRGGTTLEKAADISSWNLDGTLDLKRLFLNQPDLNQLGLERKAIESGLNAVASLDSGAWLIESGTLDLNQIPFRIDGKGTVTESLPFFLSLSNDQVDLEQVVELVEQVSGQDIPAELSLQTNGILGLNASVEGDSKTGLAKASSSIRSGKLKVAGEVLEDLLVTIVYDPQQIAFDISTLRFAGGNIAGRLRWRDISQLIDGLPELVELDLDNIRLADVATLRPIGTEAVATGRVVLSTTEGEEQPASEARENSASVAGVSTQWQTQGNLTLAGQLTKYVDLADAELTWSKTLEQSGVRVELVAADRSLQTSASVDFEELMLAAARFPQPIGFELTGSASDWKTTVRPNANVNTAIPLELDGDFQLQGNANSSWFESGRSELKRLVLSIDNRPYSLQDVIVLLSPEQLRLQQFRFWDTVGRVAGSALIQRQSMGEHQLNLRVAGIQLDRYADMLKTPVLRSIEGMADLELRLRMPASGELSAMAINLEGVHGTVDGSLADLKFRGRSLGEMTLDGQLQNETLAAILDGNLLGGIVNVNLDLPLAGKLRLPIRNVGDLSSPAPSIPFRVASTVSQATSEQPAQDDDFGVGLTQLNGTSLKGQMSGVDIERLADLFMLSPRRSVLLGSLTTEFDASIQDGNWNANALLSIPRLKQGTLPLLNNLEAKVLWNNDRVEVLQLQTALAGGRFVARGDLLLGLFSGLPLRGDFVFDARSLEVQRLVGLVLPSFQDKFDGEASYRGRVHVQRGVQVTGTARVAAATVYDVPIQQLRAPLRIVFAPDGRLSRIAADSVHGEVLDGVFDGSFAITARSKFALDARAKVARGKLDQLSRAMGFDHILGTGRFDAATVLASKDIASLNDLNGKVQVVFGNGDAGSIPLLSDLGRYVPLMQLAGVDFKGGSLNATVGSGQLRIQDLLIDSELFWVAATGSASLTGGQLDLDGILSTGGSFEEQLAQSASQNLALLVVPQIAVITEISDFIRNRSLIFHIAGTTTRPVIQPKPLETIGNTLLQNLQRQIFIPAVGGASSLDN